MPESRPNNPQAQADDQLIVRYLDGQLDEQAFAALNDRLKADPALRHRFIDLTLQAHYLNALVSEPDLTLVQDELLSHGPARTSSKFSLPTAYRVGLAAAVAAALLLVATLAIVFLPGDDTAPDVAEVPDFTPTMPDITLDTSRVVATITDQAQAEWVSVNGRGALPGRTLLGPNQRLTLARGFAEITTARGAKVLVQSPATIETTGSDNAIRLHSGKLVGRCDTPGSKGFVVHVPGMDVVDLGTVFGVEADAEHGSTVTVMEGSVRAEPAEASPLAFEPVVLKEDQARRVKPENGALETIAMSDVPVLYAQVPHPYVKIVNDAGSTLWLRQNQKDVGDRLGKTAYGKVGQGFGVLELNGQGCVDIGNTLNFASDQAFSIAVWIKPDMRSDDMCVLGRMADHLERGLHGYDLYIKEQHLRFQMKHAFLHDAKKDSLIRVESSEKLKDQTWQHVFITYDGSSRAAGLRMYLNGSEVESNVIDDSLSGNTIHANTTFRVGIRGFVDAERFGKPGLTNKLDAVGGGSPMFGGIGDLVVFDRVIGPEHIQSMHRLSRDAYFAPHEGS
ncbi:MAG: FecR domain-containing protein [Phycisphaeraceae bacterium]|nr:FecR domain-containing protein [Phycisphaeraceae bacterium]